MSQNLSSAVMAQRIEPHDSLDYFPTPPFATRALCEFLHMGLTPMWSVWESACGQGHMAVPLAEYFGEVRASDVCAYGFGEVHDFLMPFEPASISASKPDWIITNPPFRLAQAFALAALQRAACGVALLVRTAFLEGGYAKDGTSRFERLFKPHPPSMILQFCDRVPMVKGRYDPEASTATAYCWIVWSTRPRAMQTTEFRWLPPCKARLTKASDTQIGQSATAPLILSPSKDKGRATPPEDGYDPFLTEAAQDGAPLPARRA